MRKMNKKSLVDRLMARSSWSGVQTLRRWMFGCIVDYTLDAIIETVTTKRHGKLGEVQFVGFGTFRTKVRKARPGRHPITGEKIDIPEKTVVEFRPGFRFRERLAFHDRARSKRKAHV